MPSSVVKSIALKTGKSESEVEDLWQKAKETVTANYPNIIQGSDSYWALITSITKKMAGLKEMKTYKSFAGELCDGVDA
jgi:hypothetical protein